MIRFALILLSIGLLPGVGFADVPTFDEFYAGVSECRFDLSRYADLPMDPYTEAVLISLPNAGAVRGFIITTFYFSPAREGKSDPLVVRTDVNGRSGDEVFRSRRNRQF